MKKIKLVIIVFYLLCSNLFADISQKQLDDYLKVSRGGQVLSLYQRVISRGYSNSLYINDRESLYKKLLKVSKKKEFVEKFTEGLRKLDKKDYYEIMKFYETEEGKKGVQATSKFSSFDNNKTELQMIFKECKNFLIEDCFKYIDLTEWDSLSDKKKHLIEQVAQNFDVVKIKRDIRKKALISMNSVLKEPYQYSTEYIKKRATYNDQNYHKTTSNITYLFFKDFTETELEKIVDFSLSESGTKEYFLIEDGIRKYTNEFVKMIMMIYYPSKCITE